MLAFRLMELLLVGALLGLGGGLSPGPLLALVIAESLRGGKQEGIKVALSPLITDPPLVTGTLLFCRQLVGIEPLLGCLGIAGSLLVAYLGCELLRCHSKAPPPPDGLRRGIAVNLLNPHPYLFWLTVGGPMLAKREVPEILYFVAGFYTLLVGSKVAIALTGGALLQGSARLPTLRLLGAAMLVLAALLLRGSLAMLRS